MLECTSTHTSELLRSSSSCARLCQCSTGGRPLLHLHAVPLPLRLGQPPSMTPLAVDWGSEWRELAEELCHCEAPNVKLSRVRTGPPGTRTMQTCEKKTTARVCDEKGAVHNVSAGPDADNGAGARGGNQRLAPGVCDATRGTRRTELWLRLGCHASGTPPSPLSVAAILQKPLTGGGSAEKNSINWERIASDRAAPDKCFLLDQIAIASHLFSSHLSHCNLLAANRAH